MNRLERLRCAARKAADIAKPVLGAYVQTVAGQKRLADWLEKMSVTCLAVGMFQDKPSGLLLATGCLAASLYITGRLAR